MPTRLTRIVPYPCVKCGVQIREVESTTGGILIINVDPVPGGTIIPWPSDRPTGSAMGREITIPIHGEERWGKHECG